MLGCMTTCHSVEFLFLEFDVVFIIVLMIDQGLDKTEHMEFFGHKQRKLNPNRLSKKEVSVMKGCSYYAKLAFHS
jgi:hypothetical protein